MENSVPVRGGKLVQQTRGAADAGIVHQDVDAAIAFAQTVTERFHAGQIGDIASDAFCPVPTRLQVACDLLNPGFVPAGENDGGLHRGQPGHNGLPDATPAPVTTATAPDSETNSCVCI